MYICVYIDIHIYGYIALCQQKYNIQALGIIPAVETPCTLTNPHSQSLDWVGTLATRSTLNGV